MKLGKKLLKVLEQKQIEILKFANQIKNRYLNSTTKCTHQVRVVFPGLKV